MIASAAAAAAAAAPATSAGGCGCARSRATSAATGSYDRLVIGPVLPHERAQHSIELVQKISFARATEILGSLVI